MQMDDKRKTNIRLVLGLVCRTIQSSSAYISKVSVALPEGRTHHLSKRFSLNSCCHDGGGECCVTHWSKVLHSCSAGLKSGDSEGCGIWFICASISIYGAHPPIMSEMNSSLKYKYWIYISFMSCLCTVPYQHYTEGSFYAYHSFVQGVKRLN